SEVPPVPPALGEEGMPGEPRVDPRELRRRRGRFFTPWTDRREAPRADILVDVPDPSAVARGADPQELRGAVGEIHPRQPGPGDPPAAARHAGIEPLRDPRQTSAVGGESEPQDAPALRADVARFEERPSAVAERLEHRAAQPLGAGARK